MRKRINKSDRLMEYSSKPSNWGKDVDNVLFDRAMRGRIKNKVKSSLKAFKIYS